MVCTGNSNRHYASNLSICLIFVYVVGLIEFSFLLTRFRRLFILPQTIFTGYLKKCFLGEYS